MKPVSIALAAFATVLSFSSCKKESSVSNNAAALPKTYTEDVTAPYLGHIVGTYNLAYDGNGRLISMISTSAAGNKFIYQYNSDNTFTLDLYDSGQLSIHSIYWVNQAGFVDSNFQYNNTQDTSIEKYIYNGSNQLIQVKSFDYSTASGAVLNSSDQYTFDTNGNMITDVGTNATTHVEYYSDLPFTQPLGETYFPHGKNLPKTETVNSGGTITTATHTYTFDGSNRLTTEKVVTDNGVIAIKTYTY